MNKIIGGEFEINPEFLLKSGDNKIPCDYTYSSGRSALHYILKNIKKNRPFIDCIILPDYLCQSIVDIVELNNYKIQYYSLSDDFTIDEFKFGKIYSKKTAVFIINYFGIVNTEKQIQYVKNLDIDSCIILDNVQAFYEMAKTTLATYTFTSLRKWFPVPDGAFVLTNELGMDEAFNENTFSQYKILGGVVKFFRHYSSINDSIFLNCFEYGENKLQNDISSQMSNISKCLYSNLNMEQIAKARQNNATFLIEQLKVLDVDNAILEYRQDAIPLFVPIILKKRNKIKQILAQKNIFCPVHWPTANVNLKKGWFMYENELSLVIDQRYTTEDMQLIVNTIKDANRDN